MRTRKLLLAALLALAIPRSASAQRANEGLHYWAVEDLGRGVVVLRGTSGGNGFVFNNLILAPNTRYRFWVMRADTFEIGYALAATSRAGTRVSIPPVVLRPPNVFDTDEDGLSDLAETIAGTAVARADTDSDGIGDAQEVRAGTDPTDGLPTRTGIIATADTPGVAVDVCATNSAVAVADSGAGITVFNIYNRMNPRAIAQVRTRGDARRVACETGRAAVAEGAGVAIVDLSDPPAARITHYVESAMLGGSADAIAVAGGLAFVGLSTNAVVSIELDTGTVLERVALGDPVVDLAVEGLNLFALTRTRLHVIPLGRRALASVGSVASPAPGTPNARLFVGGDVAYAAHGRGYNTIDVRDPAAPRLIAAGSTQQQGWRQIVLNGSGLGVAATGPNSPLADLTADASVFDTRDTAQTNRLVASFATPGAARAVAIYNGLAYVADSAAGMHVLNYVSVDTAGVAPTIALRGSIDFGQSPPRAEEGQLQVIRAEVGDDVQVRNVEFFVGGQRVAVDGNYPFEHHFVAPRRAAQSSFTVRARVSDTGGNFASTRDYVVRVDPDTTPPVVFRVLPAAGSILGRVSAIAAFVSEPLNPLFLVPGNFALIEAGPNRMLGDGDDVPVLGGELDFRPDVLGLFRVFSAPLPAGRYRATVTANLRDLATNAFAPFSWDFETYDSTRDSDADGVPDSVEVALGLNPNRADSDGDGTPDGQEDFDNDGLVNALEVRLDRDPRNTDSDGDGISDGAEDQDRDGLTDGREVLLGTNLFERDSDGDFFADGDEVAERSNPLDVRSTPVRVAFGLLSVVNARPISTGIATGVASVRNGVVPPIGIATSVASTQNLAAPAAVLGQVEGPTLSVENRP